MESLVQTHNLTKQYGKNYYIKITLWTGKTHSRKSGISSFQLYSNAGELLAAQINGGMLMVLCAVAVIIFVSAKYKNGFIKNIANQLSRRELLVFPEIIVSSVAYCYSFIY